MADLIIGRTPGELAAADQAARAFQEDQFRFRNLGAAQRAQMGENAQERQLRQDIARLPYDNATKNALLEAELGRTRNANEANRIQAEIERTKLLDDIEKQRLANTSQNQLLNAYFLSQQIRMGGTGIGGVGGAYEQLADIEALNSNYKAQADAANKAFDAIAVSKKKVPSHLSRVPGYLWGSVGSKEVFDPKTDDEAKRQRDVLLKQNEGSVVWDDTINRFVGKRLPTQRTSATGQDPNFIELLRLFNPAAADRLKLPGSGLVEPTPAPAPAPVPAPAPAPIAAPPAASTPSPFAIPGSGLVQQDPTTWGQLFDQFGTGAAPTAAPTAPAAATVTEPVVTPAAAEGAPIQHPFSRLWESINGRNEADLRRLRELQRPGTVLSADPTRVPGAALTNAVPSAGLPLPNRRLVDALYAPGVDTNAVPPLQSPATLPFPVTNAPSGIVTPRFVPAGRSTIPGTNLVTPGRIRQIAPGVWGR